MIGAGLRFQLLGPIGVWAGDRWLRLGGPGQRSLLAALLLRANQVVSSEQLLGAVWGEASPRTAFAKLQAHVSALRHTLGDPFERSSSRQLLVTRSPGYMIAVEPEQLDLLTFEMLAEEGLRLLGYEPAEAATKLRAALSLWRGRPLDGVDLGGDFAHEAVRLEERRFAVLEAHIEAALRLGRHDEIIGELDSLAWANPLRERIHGQLMLALYRAGRRGEALDAFRRARRMLSDELGLDPGPDLQRLERAILTGDPRLEAPAHEGASRSRTERPQPFPVNQLPPAIHDLTGRDEVLKAVCGALSAESGSAKALPIVVVSGPAGIGKTTLAVRAAHEVRSSFPDGQLYLTLQDAGQAANCCELLGDLLRSLGVDGSAIPESLVERSHLYRSRMSGRRVLVVLDDAATEAQVRPLLPGSPPSAAIVTSRTRLNGIEGAGRFNLGLLSPNDAVELLARVSGRERVNSDPAAAAAIAESCGRLPLALRIAGAKLASRPHWSLARMAEHLVDERRRLDELRVGDLDVRSSLMLSYNALLPQQRSALRYAGLLASPDFAAWSVAAILDVEVATAEDLMEQLVGAWLLESAGIDSAGQARYGLHSLLRVLARERAYAEESAAALFEAEQRMIEACLALTERAALSVPGLRNLGGGEGADPADFGLAEYQAVSLAPLDWLAAERPVIAAGVARASEMGLDALCCGLAAAVSPYFSLRHHHDDWRRAQELAVRVARESGSRAGEAYARCWLGHQHLDRGDPIAAVQQFRHCLSLFSVLRDRRGEAYALHGLGTALHGRGQLAEAQKRLEASLRAFEELSDGQGEAWALYNLGACLMDHAPSAAVTEVLTRSIERFDLVGDPLGKAYATRVLGNAHLRLGHLEQAVSCLQGGLGLFATLGDEQGVALAVLSLGVAYRRMGQAETANSCLQSALATFTRLGGRFRVGVTVYELGQLHEVQGRVLQALDCYRHALSVFRDVGVRVWEGRAHRKIGDVLQASDPEAAQASWSEALAIFRELGSPEAQEIVVRPVQGGDTSYRKLSAAPGHRRGH